jgi:hypothetical protein
MIIYEYNNYNKYSSHCAFISALMKLTSLTAEAAEAFRKWRGIGQKGTFVYDQNQTILYRSRAERKFGVPMTLEMAFTESLLVQKGHFLSSPEKRALFHF